MALPGREPKDRRHGRTPVAEWTEVENRPFAGRPLPKMPGVKWRSAVNTWWLTVSTMPHCELWSESDWTFAVDCALLKQIWWDQFASKDSTPHSTLSTEIRRREDTMGTTVEARRKLRIRYVPVEDEPDQAPADAAKVTSLSDRRRRLTGG